MDEMDSYSLYIEGIKILDKLDKEQEEDVIQKYYQEADKTKRDKELRNKLVEKHLKLVIYIVNKYYSDFFGVVDKNDLIEAGNIGLINGIDNYNPSKGYKISTYLSKCILKEIKNFMSYNSYFLSAKQTTREKIMRYKVNKELLEKKYNLTLEQIASELGFSLGTVLRYERYLNTVPLQLNANINDKDTKYEDIMDDKSQNVEQIVINKEGYEKLIAIILEFYKNLNESDRKLFYNIVFEYKQLKEIAEETNVSKQAVNQRFKRIIKRLEKNRDFKTYLVRYK